jgi:hypothetical protein
MMAMAGVTTGVWLIGAVAHVVSIALHVRRVALPPVRKVGMSTREPRID